MFAQKRYYGTNTKEIAALAGVSIGTLYFQFTDKRQLLLTMLADQISGYASLEPVDFEGTAQTVTSVIFNFYDLLLSPNFVTEQEYWKRHHIACQLICRAIFRDEHC